MADPKKAGEQADAMIAEQNRLRAEAVAALAAPQAQNVEDQPPTVEAISGEGEATTHTDVSAQNDRSSVNAEIEALRAQVQVADQRWNVLQGMIKKKDSEIEQLRTLLAQVSQKRDEPTLSQPAPAVVTGQDVEDFGQDLIDLITKIANNVAQAHVAEFSKRIDAMKQSVDGVTEITSKTAREVFDDRLTARVPRWRILNEDPAFITWLSVVDDFTGYKRIDLLNDAYTRMELDRTAKFFEKFMEETRPATAPVVAQPTPTVSPVKLVEPGKSKAAAPAPQVQNNTVWTAEKIRQLYHDQRTGKLSDEEFRKLERDLFAAQRENRIAA